MHKKMAVILVSLFILVGCAGVPQDTTLKSYSSAGIMLETIHQTAAASCDAKFISGKDCNKMVPLYMKAKSAYITVGDTAILVAQSAKTLQEEAELCKASGVEKCDLTNFNLVYQSALQLYQKQAADAQKLFNELVTLSSQFKGDIK